MQAPPPNLPTAGQRWNADTYARDAGFVPALGDAVVEWLAPRPGERILDLGCGDGALTTTLAARGASIVGVDASPELVAAAAARGIEARLADGHALDFEDEFDAVFSNAALHWMREPDRVLAGVARALKPGGRFVAEFGGHGNVAAIVTALLAAIRLNGIADNGFRWFFPTPEEYAARLREHGFEVENIASIPRPTPLPTGIEGWLRTFADPFLRSAPIDAHARAIEDVTDLLAASLCDDAGRWHADYVRLRFSARLASHPSSLTDST
jgi:trans-aconitate methyltransferase